MAESKSARLTLELDLGPGRIGGVLGDDRGSSRAFDGWLQLTSAVEAALVEERERAAAEAPGAVGPAPGRR